MYESDSCSFSLPGAETREGIHEERNDTRNRPGVTMRTLPVIDILARDIISANPISSLSELRTLRSLYCT